MKFNKGGELLQQATSSLPFDSFVHDSVLSQNFMIYFLPPFYIPDNSIVQSLAGLKPLGALTQWDSTKKTKLHVHSKDDLKLQWAIDLPDIMSMYHLVDAHEMEKDQAGNTILAIRVLIHEPLDRDGVELQFTDQYRVDNNRIMAVLKEYTFRLESNGVPTFVSCNDVANDAAECEYPTLNQFFNIHQRRRYCWTNAASTKPTEWLDGIQKVDMQERTSSPVITFGKGSFAGAPAFIPCKSTGITLEDDGFILTTIYRSLEHRSDIAILDAATLKILCLMELQHHVPYQFHGDFVDSYIANDA
jgi:carotenoid cleavage dioxygenase-like enzyme